MKRRHGQVSSELTIVDRLKARHKETSVSSERKKVKRPQTSGPVAMVKVASGITIATGYQAVRLDVGIELPWPLPEPNSENDDPEGVRVCLREGFDYAYEFLDREMADRAKDVERLVKSLARKYQ